MLLACICLHSDPGKSRSEQHIKFSGWENKLGLCSGHLHQYYSISSEDVKVNFNARYVNGNRRKDGMKIAHQNLGSGFLINRMNEVETVVAAYRPHVFRISETRVKDIHDMEDIQLDGYNVFLSQTLKNPQLRTSRVAVYVNKDIKVKEHKDLMSDKFSSVWLEVGLPRKRKFLICNVYREWQYLAQGDTDSASPEAQLTRWKIFVDQWERAMSENKEIHVTGDMNIDFLKWDRPAQPTNSTQTEIRPLVYELSDKIYPHGFVQLVSEATRAWAGQQPSGLDHYYTNKPSKLSEVEVFKNGSSDHKLVFTTRYTKAQISKPRIVRKRSYKNFDPVQFFRRLRAVSWWELYQCTDVNTAVSIPTRNLTVLLDEMAPIKSIQIRTKYAPWLSQSTKEKMRERDWAQKAATESRLKSDWNTVSNKLKIEKQHWNRDR